jgi:enoyl-CoA hydratase/carnithine racemase
VSTLQVKVVDANLRRKIALEGHRFTPQEALAAGLVDRIVPGDSAEAVLSMAREFAESVDSLARSGAWGLIKVDKTFMITLVRATDKPFLSRICIEMP